MKKTDLPRLIENAGGPSKDLDRAISKLLNVPRRNYSSSVDDCLKLIHELMPAAHWHIGRVGDGVSIYATLKDGRHRAECTKTTVPLALLGATVDAVLARAR